MKSGKDMATDDDIRLTEAAEGYPNQPYVEQDEVDD